LSHAELFEQVAEQSRMIAALRDEIARLKGGPRRPNLIAAEVTIPKGGADGVLATIGGRYGGWALLVQDNKPLFAYAYSNQPDHKYLIASGQPLEPGNHIIRVKFVYAGGGIGKAATATLLVDEKEVAQGQIPQTIGVRFSLDETFHIGEDTGTPVLEQYADKMPFRFAGTLTKFVAVLAR
jgi:hypothetical protein